MEHLMKLSKTAFEGIKVGKQVIEVRLYNEKRRDIKIGDTIKFNLLEDNSKSISVTVTDLIKCKYFKELFSEISLGEWNAEGWTIDQAVECCRKFYSEEDEKKYGVLGIKFRII